MATTYAVIVKTCIPDSIQCKVTLPNKISPQMLGQNNDRCICLISSFFFSSKLQQTGTVFTHLINNMST